MVAFLALCAKYLVPAIMGWLAKEVQLLYADWQAKNKIQNDDSKAVNDAEKNDDTSGLFGG